MIAFESHTLANGLQVIVHPDATSNIAVLNIIYNVGSRDEHPDHTGFAHLFEHLMFGGSVNIPSYDAPLQKVGGENNAFTTPDVTNYYLSVPADNLETGFWLESDRMLGLSFESNVLEVQRKVVIEEFKQRYLNQPYGNAWHKLRELAYHVHPYRWPTIGKDVSHIEQATMDEVRAFFSKYYVPNNAILLVGGNIKPDLVFKLAEKWFGEIKPGGYINKDLPIEPAQNNKRVLAISENVPVDTIYKVYHMPGTISNKYYATDLMSDILGRGRSSRFYKHLVEETKIFTSINSYLTGSFDPGLMAISGKLHSGRNFEEAEAAIDNITNEMMSELVKDTELQKVKNQALSTLMFGQVDVMNRVLSLAMNGILGRPDFVNEEYQIIESITRDNILTMAQEVLKEQNSSVMYYQAAK